MEENEAIGPFVGMPVTYCIGCDRYAGKVSMVVRSNRQGYATVIRIKFDWEPRVMDFSIRANGRWVQVGREMNKAGFVRLGEAIERWDPSF